MTNWQFMPISPLILESSYLIPFTATQNFTCAFKAKATCMVCVQRYAYEVSCVILTPICSTEMKHLQTPVLKDPCSIEKSFQIPQQYNNMYDIAVLYVDVLLLKKM